MYWCPGLPIVFNAMVRPLDEGTKPRAVRAIHAPSAIDTTTVTISFKGKAR